MVTFVSQRILEGKPVVADATVHSVDSDATNTAPGLAVVYHKYADGVSTVDTPDGPVRVTPEVVDRIADVAQTITLSEEDVAAPEPLSDGAIDRPNSATLARKVRLRDGQRCANPGCHRRQGLQAHHIRYRSEGGRTVLWNEAVLCRTCHTLVHAGLVEVRRDTTGTLVWSFRVRGAAVLDVDPLSLFPQLADLTVDAPSPRASSPDVAAIDIDALASGLTSLGFTKRVARQNVETALETLRRQAKDAGSDGSIDEAVVLREALRLSGSAVVASS